MFTKKLFGVAGAALLMASGAANAAIDLSAETADQVGAVVYASESLLTDGENTVTVSAQEARIGSQNGARGTYYIVKNKAGDETAAGSGVDLEGKGIDRLHVRAVFSTTFTQDPQNTGFRVRFDLTNAVFTDNPPPQLVIRNRDPRIDSIMVEPDGNGGNFEKGNDYVIYDVPTGRNVTRADVVELKLTELAISLDQPVRIEMSLYNASRGGFSRTSRAERIGNPVGRDGVISARPALNIRAVPNTTPLTAEVATGFTRFTNDSAISSSQGLRGNVGRVMFSVREGALMRDGTPAASAEVEDLAGDLEDLVATFDGNFSVGTWTVDSSHSCSAPASQMNTLSATNTISLDEFVVTTGSKYLCVHLPRANTERIAQSQYRVSFNLPGPENTADSPDRFTGTVGEIKHNGTTIRAPYLTTYDGYNQRMILVNHGGRDADYTVTFKPESGTTATPGPYAEGMIEAGETMVIRVADTDEHPGMVRLSGETSRTAAVIDFAASQRTIDAAVTQVNLEDGSTDTVVLREQ